MTKPIPIEEMIPRAWATSEEDFVAWLGGHALVGPPETPPQASPDEEDDGDEGTNVATRVGSIGLTADLALRLAQDITHHEVLVIRKTASRLFGRAVVLGRSSSNDIVIDHPSISRKHVKFRVQRAGRVTVSDAGSANGTRVNGAYVSPGEEMELHHKDELVMGSRTFRFYEAPRLYRLLSKMTLPVATTEEEATEDE